MREPTRLTAGEGRRRWKKTATRASNGPAGVLATACIYKEIRRNTCLPSSQAGGKPQAVVRGHHPACLCVARRQAAREGQAGPYGVTERGS